jgi:L-ascorbate metabolism protein UlaG (beta-lactamase superfamily)
MKLKNLKKTSANMLIFIFSIFIISLFISCRASKNVYSGEISDHFNGKKFVNTNGSKINGLKDVFKFLRTREPGAWTKNYETYSRETLIENNDTDNIKLIFVNHSTFLIQLDTLNILTDPIWSDRCSPVQWMGPKRNRPPGVTFKSLPKIDLVLISHNHYDHLDKNTILQLQKEHAPQFVVPLGVSHFFKKLGINNVIEIDWNEEIEFKSIKIKGTPAVHFSSRGAFDKDKTLWCGYLIEGSKKIYFAGDTAYDEHIFKKIGSENPNIDVSIIPIGAYKPNWFMSSIHTNPIEAVQIHLDLKSKNSVATHFGTFALADEAQGEAGRDLKRALIKNKITNDRFIIPDEGVFYEF